MLFLLLFFKKIWSFHVDDKSSVVEFIWSIFSVKFYLNSSKSSFNINELSFITLILFSIDSSYFVILELFCYINVLTLLFASWRFQISCFTFVILFVNVAIDAKLISNLFYNILIASRIIEFLIVYPRSGIW